MIPRGVLTVTLTPELRQLALNHAYENLEGEELDDAVRWFQEQETPDGFVLDAADGEPEAAMITIIAHGVWWSWEDEPEDDE